MRIVTILIGVILLLLLCCLPAQAQLGRSLSVPAPTLHSCPPTHFRVVAVSGSAGTFVLSSFMSYQEAVATGTGTPSHSVFLSYEEAVQRGRGEPNANTKSVAEAAREYRARRHAKVELKQD